MSIFFSYILAFMALVLTFTFIDSLKSAMYQDADQLHSPGYKRQLLGFKIEEAH